MLVGPPQLRPFVPHCNYNALLGEQRWYREPGPLAHHLLLHKRQGVLSGSSGRSGGTPGGKLSSDYPRITAGAQSAPLNLTVLGIEALHNSTGDAPAQAIATTCDQKEVIMATASVPKMGPSSACAPPGVTDKRALAAFEVRLAAATEEAEVKIPPHTTNGDEARYADKCGTYSKCIKQDRPGVVNPAAYQSFRKAINSGSPGDYANIQLGGPRKLNDPQAALAFTMVGTDAEQFGNGPSPENQESVTLVPPAPALASEAYGTELTELYWCSLLRDVAFTAYGANVVAGEAAQELTSMPTYAGPRDGSGEVTPDLLFRGAFPGETVGPYLSQFYIQPTNMGAQSIDQRMIAYVPNLDYMTDIGTWGDVQNGIPTGLANKPDPTPRYLHDGRGLAAFTHVDELYQSYFTAYLLMATLSVPKNPGNPYSTSKTQQGFGTFGGPDFASTLAEVAKIALNAVWYQKWNVHLRHRPESGGGIVQLIKMGQGSTLDGAVNNNVLNSKALQASSSKYGGSFLLSQAFPEGSPAHPAYPTGHGTVGGACITILKFFFDGTFVIPGPKVPASDGLSLLPYTAAEPLTVNGELNKLAHNVSFGHGLHAGIHWRSDSDSSMLLGEAVAISFLQDKAQTYNEKFEVKFTKLDGTTATITNVGGSL